jgi:hypothetical protein
MSQFELLPQRLRELSISPREIVLPIDAALEAIDLFESRGVHILGWEGWVKDAAGKVGHGTAPQGSASLDKLSLQQAAQLCRDTIPGEAAQWARDNAGTTDQLHFCLTVWA